MKKLLAFVMVLGLATVASAAIDFSCVETAPNTFRISLNTDVDMPSQTGLGSMLWSVTGGSVIDGSLNLTAQDAEGVGYAPIWMVEPTYYSTANEVFVSAVTAEPGSRDDPLWCMIGAGEIFNFEVSATNFIYITYEAGSVDGVVFAGPSSNLVFCPEPMTMSLLGLGGLGLLRRRRG